MIFFSSTSLKYFLFLRAFFLISELKISPLTSQKSWKSEYHCLYHKLKFDFIIVIIITIHNPIIVITIQSNHDSHNNDLKRPDKNYYFELFSFSRAILQSATALNPWALLTRQEVFSKLQYI